jgi:MFS family permease
MCTPDAHPDSFPDTEPFDLAMSINLIPASGAFGKIIASYFIVRLSNKIGRKPALLICLLGGAATCVLKYLLRGTYLGFIAANFVTGLFGASIIVGLAYIEDLYGDEPGKKQNEIDLLYFGLIMGGSCGNLVAIALYTSEDVLFTGLLVGAGASVLAAVGVLLFMVEASVLDKADSPSLDNTKDAVDDGDIDTDSTPNERFVQGYHPPILYVIFPQPLSPPLARANALLHTKFVFQ